MFRIKWAQTASEKATIFSNSAVNGKGRKPLNRLISSALVLICLLFNPNIQAAPRTFGFQGTATTTNSQETSPFNPTAAAVCNDSATITLWVDMADGVAVAEEGGNNIAILPGECHSWTFEDKSVVNEFIIGLITGSSTAAYHGEAVR